MCVPTYIALVAIDPSVPLVSPPLDAVLLLKKSLVVPFGNLPPPRPVLEHIHAPHKQKAEHANRNQDHGYGQWVLVGWRVLALKNLTRDNTGEVGVAI